MTTQPPPATTEHGDDAPTQEPSMCDVLCEWGNKAARDKTSPPDYIDGFKDAIQTALKDCVPFELRLIAAETELARIRHALAIPDDADLVDQLKDLYAQWEQSENEAGRPARPPGDG